MDRGRDGSGGRHGGDPRRRLALKAAVVFAASFAFCHHLQFQTPHIPGYDGYYHIKIAYLMRTLGFLREFKWAVHSVWATHFADKELLYHVFLLPFTHFENLATGLKHSAVLLGSAALTTFYVLVARNGFRYPAVWFLLLCAAGPHFLYRINAPRPQVLSVLLLLLSVHLLIRRRRLALAIVAFVYTWSYTAFHLPLVLAVIVSLHLLLVERRLDWQTPLAVLAALALGVVVNPYFPDNLRIFHLQNLAVPWMALRTDVDLSMAHEVGAFSSRELLLAHPAVIVPFAAAFYLALVRPRPLDARTASLFPLAASVVFLTLLGRRFVEYSVPLSLFFLAGFYSRQLEGFDLRAELAAGGRRRARVVGAIAAIAVGLALLHVWSYPRAAAALRSDGPLVEEAARYLKDHTVPDEPVFSCDWDDVPALFYFNHRNRYPVFLDPSFMYFHDPERWREWHDVARGRLLARSYDVLAREYRFGVCTWDFDRLKWIVENDPRMEIVLDTGNSYVFRIDRDDDEIPLDRLLLLGSPPWRRAASPAPAR